MKKLLLLLAIAGCITSVGAKAQTVNNVKLSDLKAEYIEVTEYRRLMGEKTFISLDYGQEKDLNNFRDLIVKDDQRKYLEYNSVIDFINKMKPNGYELFQVYTLGNNDASFPRYVLKRNDF